MRRQGAVAAFALVLVVCNTAKATTIQGHGTQSCGVWIEEHRKASTMSLGQDTWLTGFLTGYNFYGPQPNGDILRGTDIRGAVAWMTNYCTANSLETIADASNELIKTLLARLNR